jgi:hypothetical protein
MIFNKKITWKNANKARARIKALEDVASFSPLPNRYMKELIDLKTAYNIYKAT